MTDSIVHATVRLTVVGDGGRVDVAVPLWTEIASLAETYVERTGSGPVTLHTSSGRGFAPRSTVHGEGLAHGDLLVAISGTGLPGRRVKDGSDDDDVPAQVAPPRPSGRRALMAPIATGAIGVVVAVAGALEGGTAADGATAALLVISLLAVLLARHTGRVDRAWLAVVPLLVAAGAGTLTVTTLDDGDAGDVLLVAAVAGLVAAATAAVVRAGSPHVADDWLLAWMFTGCVLAASAAACLLMDWSTTTFWVLVLTLATVSTRLVPSRVVEVPDHVLLDFARLAVTAWTAREQPRRSFRGVIRRDDVESVARKALRLVDAASVFGAVAVVAATVALLMGDHGTSRRIGIIMLCIGVGGSFALGGRTLRIRTARRAQRSAGTIVLVLVTLYVFSLLDDTRRPIFTAAAVGLGLLLVVVARAAARGWSSVRWSRTAETAETLAGVLVYGALPLATGLFTWMRVLTSP
ncbi:hypothetical protein [Aeromicrobium chenweiae]|uniref:EccD-like transmembrane domain-containing protein n=1 Tax=Aeromicrobium chenweiae TaxID=2079793 RepID=A0A2S0WQL1_9ACTN|nr:hypothetical protein [Aeromicrobium chenweiae]AWB93607.1 hypothetical protein C3E78_16090 [Aeromicrobium chenweiae]TGN33257.1 hypothetical protein E4L97_06105 [Aeromicrobium chenweiae]